MLAKIRHIPLFLGILVTVAMGISAIASGADADSGKQLAVKLCTNCHIVGGDQRGSDAVPSFSSMANNAIYSDNRLRGWLFNPHPPMPAIDLSRTEVDAIIAYIRSLQR